MDIEEGQLITFNLICPECGVGNPENADYCMVCERDLRDTLLFLEDDFFDLEITSEYLIEYRKTFWGTNRTGKVNKYLWKEMSNLEFGSEITRFKFDYKNKRHVLPLKQENMELFKEKLKSIL